MRHAVGHLCSALLLLLAIGCKRKPEPPKEAEQPSTQAAAQELQALKAAGTPQLCIDVCTRVPELRCGEVATCGDGCRQMMALPVCHGDVEAFLGCAARQPVDRWKCDQAGPTPALKEGHCTTEQRALSECLARAGQAQ